jgi:hypothetical protein
MKSILFLIGITFCSISFAQNGKKMNTTHTNIVKIGTNTFFDGDEFPFNASWETKVANRQSLQIGLSPRLYKNDFQNTGGIALSLAYRKYISKGREGLQGLYFSPVIKYGFFKDKQKYTDYIYTGPTTPPIFTEKTNSYKVNSLNLGFLFGKQWVYKSGFSLDISGGIGFYNNKYDGDTNNYYYRNNQTEYGLTPNINISIGYAF